MPTTTNRGARTSGAALPFSGRPSAGAMKRQRRRYQIDRDAQGIPQGRLPTLIGCGAYWLGTSRITGPRGAGATGAAGTAC